MKLEPKSANDNHYEDTADKRIEEKGNDFFDRANFKNINIIFTDTGFLQNFINRIDLGKVNQLNGFGFSAFCYSLPSSNGGLETQVIHS